MTRIPGLARGFEHAPGRRDRLAQQRHVVAERLAKSARIDEVALHVDDDERNVFELKNKFVWLSAYARHDFPPQESAA